MRSIKNIAIYARVSTEEQAVEGFSIQAQLETLRDDAKKNGHIIYKEYVDEGISGKTIEKRPALQSLLRDAQKGLFDEVIVWKINRISRKTLDLLNIVESLKKYSVVFRSFTERFETETAMGQFALQMMGAVAELERNQIVDNVKMGMTQRAKQGKWNGGMSLGYKTVEIEGSNHRRHKETRLQISESEAAIVKIIFEKYASGKGYKSITNELNYQGYKTKSGKPFSIATIKGILANPIYIGKIRFNKQQDWNTKRRKGTNPTPLIVDGEHEAIICIELWDKVEARRSMVIKHPSRVFYGSFPFTGIMRCPVCDHGMVAQRATRKSKKTGEIKYTPYYQCGQFTNKGSSVCRANSVRVDYAEAEILARIQTLVNQPQLIEDVCNSINRKKNIDKSPLEADLKVIIKELVDINRKKDKYFKLFDDDGISGQSLKEKLTSIDENEQHLQKRKKDIEHLLSDKNIDESVSVDAMRSVLGEFIKLFSKLNNEQQKLLVHAVIRRITVTGDRKIDKIELKFDEVFPLNA